MPTPPITTAERTPWSLPKRTASSPICSASSLVGASTRARGPCARGPCESRSRMGKRNAAVLPVPVAAQPITSLPSIAGGMARAWMGVGASKPACSRACKVRAESPSAEKVTPQPNASSPQAAGKTTLRSRLARKEGRVDTSELRANIEKAKQRLISAEKAMQTALETVQPAARADKAIISNALQTAFAELRKAKDEVLALEKQIVR